MDWLFFFALGALSQSMALKEISDSKKGMPCENNNSNESTVKIEKLYFTFGMVIIGLPIYLFVISLDWSWTYNSRWLWYGKYGLGHWYEIHSDESWLKFLYYPFDIAVFILGFWICKSSVGNKSNVKENNIVSINEEKENTVDTIHEMIKNMRPLSEVANIIDKEIIEKK